MEIDLAVTDFERDEGIQSRQQKRVWYLYLSAGDIAGAVTPVISAIVGAKRVSGVVKNSVFFVCMIFSFISNHIIAG